jgi:dolichol-phosphate mannosyltransferase
MLSPAHRAALISLCKFGAVGGSGILVNLFVFHVLFSSGLPVLLATPAAFLAGALSNYLFNSLWTFHEKTGRLWRSLLAVLVVMGINTLCTASLVFLGTIPLLAQLCGIGMTLPINWAAHRYWVFTMTTVEPVIEALRDEARHGELLPESAVS